MQILIIRPGAVGDTLVTMPVLQQLRATYTNTDITFVGNTAVLPLLQAFQLADNVASYEHPQWGELFIPLQSSNPRRQRHLPPLLQQIDIAICWLRDTEGIVTHNLRAAGISQIVVAPGRPPAHEQIHIVDYLAQSLEVLGLAQIPWHIPHEYQWPEEHTYNQAQQAAALVIHPGSGSAQKCWPIAYFKEIITMLWQRQIPVKLLGGPADQTRITQLMTSLPTPPQLDILHILIDRPLLSIAHELQQSRGYLGNDSGITHLAALQGVPTTALFGPSDPIIWRPIGPRVTILYEPELSMLKPATVLTHLLAQHHADNKT